MARPEANAPEAVADPVAGRYLRGCGRPGDAGVIAESEGRPIGAAWYRLFTASEPGHGFVAHDIPEIAIAIVPGARSAGVGTALIASIIELARRQSVHSLSLSVSVHNPVALRLYRGAGFVRVTGADDHPTLLLTIPPVSDLVAWITGTMAEVDEGSRRLATVVDRDERAVVLFETDRWGPVVAKAGHRLTPFECELIALDAASAASDTYHRSIPAFVAIRHSSSSATSMGWRSGQDRHRRRGWPPVRPCARSTTCLPRGSPPSFDPAQRATIYQQLCKVLADDQPWNILWETQRYWIVSNKIGKFYLTPAPGGGSYYNASEHWYIKP